MEIKLFDDEICAILCDYLESRGIHVESDEESSMPIAKVQSNGQPETVEFVALIRKIDGMDIF